MASSSQPLSATASEHPWSRQIRHQARLAGARVCAGSKVRLGIYSASGKLAGKAVWAVYPNPWENPTAIKAFEVIRVCPRTGKILYAGSAHDEG